MCNTRAENLISSKLTATFFALTARRQFGEKPKSRSMAVTNAAMNMQCVVKVALMIANNCWRGGYDTMKYYRSEGVSCRI